MYTTAQKQTAFVAVIAIIVLFIFSGFILEVVKNTVLIVLFTIMIIALFAARNIIMNAILQVMKAIHKKMIKDQPFFYIELGLEYYKTKLNAIKEHIQAVEAMSHKLESKKSSLNTEYNKILVQQQDTNDERVKVILSNRERIIKNQFEKTDANLTACTNLFTKLSTEYDKYVLIVENTTYEVAALKDQHEMMKKVGAITESANDFLGETSEEVKNFKLAITAAEDSIFLNTAKLDMFEREVSIPVTGSMFSAIKL